MVSATLVAVPFGDDDVTGDSSFIPTDEEEFQIPANVNASFEELLGLWKTQEEKEGALDEDSALPVGFWLMRRKDLDVACIPMNNDWGNDSQWYSLVRSAKSICQSIAVKTVIARRK